MTCQPFSVRRDLLLVCDRSILVSVLDANYRALSETRKIPNLPCDSPCQYAGTAISNDGNFLLIVDECSPRLIMTSPTANDPRLVSELAQRSSFLSLSFAFGWFWGLVTDGDLGVRLAVITKSGNSTQYLNISEGWGPHNIYLDSFSVVLSCCGRLVLYNSFRGLLYWLLEDGSLESYREVEQDRIFGPSADGTLIQMSIVGATCIVSAWSSPNDIIHLAETSAPCDTIEGIARTENGTLFIMGDHSRLFALPRSEKRWREVASF